MLDNFDHIKTYWVMTGLKLAQTALFFGADDMDGTVVEEVISLMSGAATRAGGEQGRAGAGDPRRRPDAGGARRALPGGAALRGAGARRGGAAARRAAAAPQAAPTPEVAPRRRA